jgi:hypothetical protein
MIPVRAAPDTATCWDRLIRGGYFEEVLAHEPAAVLDAIRRDAVESLERYRRGEDIRVMSEVICAITERL